MGPASRWESGLRWISPRDRRNRAEPFARGLLFTPFEPLPGDSQVWVYSKPGINNSNRLHRADFNTILEKCGDLLARSDRFGFQLCRRAERLEWVCVRVFALQAPVGSGNPRCGRENPRLDFRQVVVTLRA